MEPPADGQTGLVTRLKDLTDDEQCVLNAAHTGEEVKFGDSRPTDKSTTTVIRGEVIYEAVASLHAPLSPRGVRLRGAYIEGDIDLAFSKWRGQLALQDCTVTGEILLSHAEITGLIKLDGSDIGRIQADGAHIDGSILIRRGALVRHGLHMIGVTVTNSFNATHSHIAAPKDKPKQQAIELFRSNIGDLHLNHMTVNGGIYAAGMTIHRNLRIHSSEIKNRRSCGEGWEDETDYPDGAINLGGTEVDGSLYVSHRRQKSDERALFAAGRVNLSAVSCKRLFVNVADLSQNRLRMDGLVYDRLNAITPEEMLTAITQMNKFRSQPYVQLAKFCESSGQLSTRGKVLIALEKQTTRRTRQSLRSRAIRYCYGALVGYGYRPAFSLFWLLVAIGASSCVLHVWGRFLVPADGTHRPETWSDAVGYTLDNLLPFASLGIRDKWVVDITSGGQWAWLAIFLVLKFFAWGLAALALASITGIIRRPHST